MNAPPPLRRGACPRLAVPMPTGDGLLARLACPGITIGLDTMAALCAAARRHSNGIIEVTARGSIQVRGLTATSASAFAEAVAALGIDPDGSIPILVDPLAGLEAEPAGDACGLADKVRERLADAPFAAALSPKVSIAIDGGHGLRLDAIRADIRLRADGAHWCIGLGGDASTATPTGMVTRAAAADAAVRLIIVIAQHGPQARARELVASQGVALFRAAIADLLIDPPALSGHSAEARRDIAAPASPPPCGEGSGVGVGKYGTGVPDGTTPLSIPPPREVGSTRLRHQKWSKSDKSDFDWGREEIAALTEIIATHPVREGLVALGIGLAFGHTDVDALDRLVDAARRADASGLRTAPGRAMLVIGLTSDAARRLADDADCLGFITHRGDPRRSVVACAGAPICASAKIPARGLAPLISTAAADLLDGSLTLHLSGCRKGCAHPQSAALTMVGDDNGCGIVVDGSAREQAQASVVTESLQTGLRRVAAAVVRARQPSETSAQVLSRFGAAHVAALLGGDRGGNHG